MNAPMARPSSTGRPTASPFQNGSLPGHARRRGHDHPVGADVLDPPAARAEDDDVAVHPGPQLVDHLLVELADPPTRVPASPSRKTGYRPRSGIVPPLRDGDGPGVPPALDHVGHAVPGDPRLELGELVGRVGAREHPEDALQRLARQRLERRGPPDDLRAARRP